MNDLTLSELATLMAVFNRAGISNLNEAEQEMFTRITQAHAEREEVESMDDDDSLGGTCKL